MNLLRPDGKLNQVLSTVADLVAINLMALVCCIPIITIGASVTAAYSCPPVLQKEDVRMYRPILLQGVFRFHYH